MTLLQQLRDDTRDLHDTTESVAYVDKIKAATMTTDDYADLLLKNYVIHDRLENALAAAASVVEEGHPLRDFLRPQRVDLILEDLESLDREAPMLPMDMPLQIYSLPGLVGTLYVVEGSSMGSKMIAKQLKRSEQIESGASFEFYETMGRGSSDRWQHFRSIVSDRDWSESERGEVIAAARRTFEFIREVFTG